MVQLTDDEKRIIKREKHREYMRKRRSEDPEFNAKQKELNRNRKKFLYNNDEEYKEKQKIKCKQYAKDKSNYKKLYQELLEKTQNIA
tara:strand:+ start:741 stop:1001 length:261 start_codon:yes stop_codon:yes gene_type:complete